MLGEKRNSSLFQATPMETVVSPDMLPLPEPTAILLEAIPADCDVPETSIINTLSTNDIVNASELFFMPTDERREFGAVLADVQEYVAKEYSSLLTEDGSAEAKVLIKRYISKFVQDRRMTVKDMTANQLVDALYTEMAEFSFLTKYINSKGIEEIDGATRS